MLSTLFMAEYCSIRNKVKQTIYDVVTLEKIILDKTFLQGLSAW